MQPFLPIVRDGEAPHVVDGNVVKWSTSTRRTPGQKREKPVGSVGLALIEAERVAVARKTVARSTALGRVASARSRRSQATSGA